MKPLYAALLCMTWSFAACAPPAPAPAKPHHTPPSAVENPIPESDLTRVRLTPKAIARLAIQTDRVEPYDGTTYRRVGAEVIAPPGQTILITAPVAGVVHLDPTWTSGAALHKDDALFSLSPLASVDRDTQARANREVDVARADLAALETRLSRTQALMLEGASSQRAIEEATAARDVARANLKAAQARTRMIRANPLLSDVTMSLLAPRDGILRTLSVSDGQPVAAGAALAEVVSVQTLWVRVPILSSDLHRIVPEANARVSALTVGGHADGANSQPSAIGQAVAGPPTANPAAGTVDRYYVLDSEHGAFSPGERVMVALPLQQAPALSSVPRSAVLYDAHGSTWVYICDDAHTFRRARVEVLHSDGALAVLGRAPSVGTCIVSVGAAEVYGAEFEPGH